MQATDLRDGNHFSDPAWHDRAGVGTILVERKMRAGALEVVDVRGQAVDPWTTAAASRFPPPVRTESSMVPADYSLRLDDGDRVQDRRVQSIQPDEQQAVRIPEP